VTKSGGWLLFLTPLGKLAVFVLCFRLSFHPKVRKKEGEKQQQKRKINKERKEKVLK
jgi:hypothetical protein